MRKGYLYSRVQIDDCAKILKRNLQGVPDITCKGTDREVKNTMPPATAGTSLQARETYFVVAGSNSRRATSACEDSVGKVAVM